MGMHLGETEGSLELIVKLALDFIKVYRVERFHVGVFS